jgi:DNA-binding Lrp family transcriptional regulator
LGEGPHVVLIPKYVEGMQMPEAYITGKVTPGSESEVKEKISKIEGIKKVAIVYGVYDFVAEVEVKELAELNELMTRLRRIPSITKTETYIVRSE